MKKLILVLFLAFAFVLATTSTYASGDKVRGEESEGPSYQLCESSGGDCPYGDPDF